MHYYIYPAGGGGKSVAWLIDYFNEIENTEVTFTFIDDSKKEMSLKYFSKQIGDDEILICSHRNYEILVDNLLHYGIKKFSDGIEKYASKLNMYFNGSKGIGIIRDDYKSQKHLGSIDKELIKMGYNVFYFILVNSYEFDTDTNCKEQYFRYSVNTLMITIDFLPYIEFCFFMIGTARNFMFSKGVKYMCLCSSYYIPNFHSYYHSEEHNARVLTMYETMSFGGSYIICSNKRSYKAFVDFFDKYNGDKNRLLKLGYPSFDFEMQNIKLQKDICKDTVIIASVIISEMIKQKTRNLVEKLLCQGYRVLYKTHNGHPEFLSLEQEFCECWMENDNFVFYDDSNLTSQELKRSITLIEYRSSILYTYPLITGKPSIIMQPDSGDFNCNENVVDNFYEEKLQIKAFCVDEVLEIIKSLQDEYFCKKREKMIQDYRKNDAYCFGGASKEIASFIDGYSKKYLQNKL